jgi:hypothetical protein
MVDTLGDVTINRLSPSDRREHSGIIFAQAISHFASLFDGLVEGRIDDPDFMKVLERDLIDGNHLPDSSRYFTTSHFHRPEELEAEVREVGFMIYDVVPVQGPGWLVESFGERWAGLNRRAQLLEVIQMVEHEPTMIEMSIHFAVIGRK